MRFLYYRNSIALICIMSFVHAGFLIELNDGRICPACIFQTHMQKLRIFLYGDSFGNFIMTELLHKIKNPKYIMHPVAKLILRKQKIIDAKSHISDIMRSILRSQFLLKENTTG